MATKTAKPANRGRPATGKLAAARVSVSLPPDIARTLQDIAKQKKVSVAWVMRDAAEKYIADQWPLFGTASDRRGEA